MTTRSSMSVNPLLLRVTIRHLSFDKANDTKSLYSISGANERGNQRRDFQKTTINNSWSYFCVVGLFVGLGRVLEIDRPAPFARDDDVEIAVAIEIDHRDV